MAAGLAQFTGNWLSGALRHDRVGTAAIALPPHQPLPADLLRSGPLNALLARRAPPAAPLLPQRGEGSAAAAAAPPLASRVRSPATHADLLPDRPEAGAELLAGAADCPALQAAIYADALLLARALAEALPTAEGAEDSGGSGSRGSYGGPELRRRRLRAKLEVVARQSCPRWHADSVGARALCTYEGPGTLFVANRHVRRRWGLDGSVAVESVDEAAAQQARPWDLLILKGNAFPGLAGMGAVHKSPAMGPDDPPRLLLTVDDSEPCGCGHAH